MLKMTLWLVAAIALGFVFGWLLSKAVQKKKYDEELDALDSALVDRNEMLEKLEKKFRNEKVMSQKVSKELRKAEETLFDKTSLVTQLQVKLDKAKNSQNNEDSNKSLYKQIELLEERDLKRLKELEGFESVLLKSEEIMEENQSAYEARVMNLEEQIELLTLENEEKLKSVELYQDTIAEFEEELKLYTANSGDAEFVISKDQFTKIEEQLEHYQKEILTLRSENDDFKKSKEQGNEKVEKEPVVQSEELDDGSIVKLFRETYKKITKS